MPLPRVELYSPAFWIQPQQVICFGQRAKAFFPWEADWRTRVRFKMLFFPFCLRLGKYMLAGTSASRVPEDPLTSRTPGKDAGHLAQVLCPSSAYWLWPGRWHTVRNQAESDASPLDRFGILWLAQPSWWEVNGTHWNDGVWVNVYQN